MKKPTYFVVFPQAMNLDLVKDLGFIPHILATCHGYDAHLLTYCNDEYTWHTEIPGTKITFLKKRFGEVIDVLLFLCKNSHAIDVLHIEHLQGNDHLVFGFLYKLRNPKGILYYKLDASPHIMMSLVNRPKTLTASLKTQFLRWMLRRKIDLISVEDCNHLRSLREEYPFFADRILHLPNGFHIASPATEPITAKKPWILTSARIGAYQKASDILLEAFALFTNDCPDWKLILAGPIEPEFQGYLDSYFKTHSDLRERVVLFGYVKDRTLLSNLYAQSAIFCLPSRWEGFSHAIMEAAYFGDYIIATNAGGAKDILDKTHFGNIVPYDDPTALAAALRDAIRLGSFRTRDPLEMQAIIEREFSWTTLCAKLDSRLQSMKNAAHKGKTSVSGPSN
ncbi:MAG: glycosyltransferase family 4 protein [Chthoniobacter sp.]|nr:glycosyltransferase family 4 protein [Chthoniobacter sp.]